MMLKLDFLFCFIDVGSLQDPLPRGSYDEKRLYPCFYDIVILEFMSNFPMMCYMCMQLDAEVIKYFSL